MHAHLTHLSEPSATLQSLTEQAAFFLLSTCIRSAEGRKRIVNEIVQTLSPSDKADSKLDEQTAVRRAASNPYKVQPGFPAPHKVLMLPVDGSIPIASSGTVNHACYLSCVCSLLSSGMEGPDSETLHGPCNMNFAVNKEEGTHTTAKPACQTERDL